MSTGTVVIGPERITVTLDVPAEDLLHHRDVGTSPRGARCSAEWLRTACSQYAAVLAGRLVIRAADGERLGGRSVAGGVHGASDEAFDWGRLRQLRAGFTLEFSLASPQPLLTFQLTDAGNASHLQSQLALDVRGPGVTPSRTVVLTSRGNAETLEFPPDPRDAPDRFKSVLAWIQADGPALEMEVHIPLTLLETWRPMVRRDPDFLEADEQQAAIAELLPFFSSVNRVEFDGFPATGDPPQFAFIPPRAKGILPGSRYPAQPHPTPQRLSAWTARLAVRTRYLHGAPFSRATVAWGLFNNAVLTARASVAIPGRTFEHDFTTYQPTLTLRGATRAGLTEKTVP